MNTFENSSFVSILIDAMCAMWIDSSCRPIQCGVYCTTLAGEMRTWVGNRWLPLLSRLARNTSPGAKGRPLSHTHQPSNPTTPIAAAIVHQIQADSPVTSPNVKLFTILLPSAFAGDVRRGSKVFGGFGVLPEPQRNKEPPLPYRAPGSPGHSARQFLSGKPIRYYRPKGSPEIRRLVDAGF